MVIRDNCQRKQRERAPRDGTEDGRARAPVREGHDVDGDFLPVGVESFSDVEAPEDAGDVDEGAVGSEVHASAKGEGGKRRGQC